MESNKKLFYSAQYSICLRRVWLSAVLDIFGFLKMYSSDSAQCQPVQSLTPHGVSLRGVSYSRIYPRNWIFKQNHFNLFIRGPDGFDSWKKMPKIVWHCHFKYSYSMVGWLLGIKTGTRQVVPNWFRTPIPKILHFNVAF